MTRIKEDHRSAFLFLLPVLAGLLLFRLYPIGRAVVESLFTTVIGGGRQTKMYIGVGNYLDLFADPVFWNSFWVTVKFNVIVNPLQILLALVLAILLTREKPGAGTLRSIYMVPIGMSISVASVIWQIMLNPNQGIANGFLSWLGIAQQPFFTSASQALWCIILLTSWKGVAFWMIFIIAGLQDISKNLYEAADIDGTNFMQKTMHITIPLLRRVLLFVLVADTSVNFILFAPMYIITGGGPQETTNVLMYEAYRSGFIYGDFGRSMAIVTILLATLLLVVGVQFRLLGREE
jgi:multiple sugar transport system permease protein